MLDDSFAVLNDYRLMVNEVREKTFLPPSGFAFVEPLIQYHPPEQFAVGWLSPKPSQYIPAVH